MTKALVDSVVSRWAQLGVMLNVREAGNTPDIEHLLLDTARVASANSRLFILAASWLALYGDYVTKHRLARLIGDELEPEHRTTLGFLLEWAKENGEGNGARFNLAIAACNAAADPGPLSDVERRNAAFSRLAEQRASALSRKWGRWLAEFELKSDALRPAEWIAKHNPTLRERALTGGDLLASVLAECTAEAGIIESEAELARRCGASRPAVRDAIRRLRLAGLVRSIVRGRANVVELCERPGR
ncbi:MAG: GntR family transcriptional regulator [Planctomycetota bacterium]|nr:GntR family transcriptional regulator [Planctomycetota bacterium]